MKLTLTEQQFLKEYAAELELCRCEENIDGEEFCQHTCTLGSKVARAILTNLMKKKVLRYNKQPHCWNPLFKDDNYEEAIQSL